MAVQILDSQGNPVLGEGDADQLTAEEIAALKAEGEEIPETPPEKSPEKKEETPPEKKEPPQQNLQGETARLRNERNQLREARDRQDTELRRLQEENSAFKARQQFQREEAQRLNDAQTKGARPDPIEDPIGAELYDLKQEAAANKQLRERFEAQEKQQEENKKQWDAQQESQRKVREFLDQDVDEYRAAHPEKNYDAAAKYAYDKYAEYWSRRGLTQQEVQAMAANMFFGLGFSHQQRGGSAAEAVVDLAEQWGYVPTQQPEQSDDKAPAGGNVDVSAARAKLERIKKGQKLQGLGGKTGSQRNPTDLVGGMTAEDLAGISDDEYVALKQDKEKGKILAKRLEELG